MLTPSTLSSRHADTNAQSTRIDFDHLTTKGKARVTSIIQAARAIFLESGYDGISMRQVADRCEITLSSLQHYFPSRESLLAAVLWDVSDRYDRDYAKIAASKKNPEDKFKAIITLLIKDCKKPETEKIFVEMWSAATRDMIARTIFDQMYSYHRRTLEHYLNEVNPKLTEKQRAHRAAIIAMQIEGLMLLISDAKPKHAELNGIEQECMSIIEMIVNAP